MNRQKIIFSAFVALWIGLIAAAPLPVAQAQSTPRKLVVVLSSYHEGYQWTDDIVEGIRSALAVKKDEVEIQYEYMDTKRVFDEEYVARLYAIYQYKYAKRTPDLIFSSDDDALNFLVKYRNELFPGAPVVFCGVNYFEPAALQGKRGFTGVNEEADIRSTLDLALKIHPNVRQIAVVNDLTTTGKRMHEKFVEIQPLYESRVRFKFLEDLTMAEVETAVSQMGEDSLVFYTLFFRDKAGVPYSYDESIHRVSRASRVPVYGTWDFSLGHGIVGGMLASGRFQGSTAGELGLRILDGEPVDAVEIVMESPNQYLFDYRELDRFDISTGQLPRGSIVINQPVSFLSQYWRWILGTGAVLLVMLGVVLQFARRNKQLKEAEQLIRTSNEELQKVNDSLEERSRWLRATIQCYKEYTAQLGRGNLAAQLLIDEHGSYQEEMLVEFGLDLTHMAQELRDMIGQIHEATVALNSTATEILASTTQQAAGASEQSSAIAETTATVDEVRAISEQAVQRAQEVAGAAQQTVETSRAGQQAVQATIESMNLIKAQVEDIAQRILELSDHTQQIGEIIESVNAIASQSNMLALNASVEAARAGEQGRGFAVVASEVRTLSEQSRAATQQVKNILSEIQKATNSTVMATEEGVKAVDIGVQRAAQARKSIEKLSEVITQASQAAIKVSAGGQQQTTGMDQLSVAMRAINQATLQSLASTREAEKAARDLNELATRLSHTVEQYHL